MRILHAVLEPNLCPDRVYSVMWSDATLRRSACLHVFCCRTRHSTLMTSAKQLRREIKQSPLLLKGLAGQVELL